MLRDWTVAPIPTTACAGRSSMFARIINAIDAALSLIMTLGALTCAPNMTSSCSYTGTRWPAVYSVCCHSVTNSRYFVTAPAISRNERQQTCHPPPHVYFQHARCHPAHHSLLRSSGWTFILLTCSDAHFHTHTPCRTPHCLTRHTHHAPPRPSALQHLPTTELLQHFARDGVCARDDLERTQWCLSWTSN